MFPRTHEAPAKEAGEREAERDPRRQTKGQAGKGRDRQTETREEEEQRDAHTETGKGQTQKAGLGDLRGGVFLSAALQVRSLNKNAKQDAPVQ